MWQARNTVVGDCRTATKIVIISCYSFIYTLWYYLAKKQLTLIKFLYFDVKIYIYIFVCVCVCVLKQKKN
jgi:hypothetical protein